MMHKLIFKIFIFFQCLCYGQIIDNSHFQFLTDEPFFNADYIQKNNIKKITGHYSIKADLDRIRKSDRIYEYSFDSSGKLSTKWTTYYFDYKTNDTTITLYEYDKNDRLIELKKSDQFGYYSYHYTYNDSGDVVEEEFRQDLKNQYKKSDFYLNENFRVYKEKSTYEYFEKQKKRTFFNDEGRPYQYTITYFDEQGRMTEEYTQLLVNTGNQKAVYTYNENGLPQKKSFTSQLTTKITKEHVFEYDENNNLLEYHYFKDGQHKSEVQIVYSWKSGALKAFLTKTDNTNYITILEFDYEYYNK